MKPTERKIVVIGDRDFVNIFKVIGMKEYYIIEGDRLRESVRRLLLKILEDETTGLIILMEDLEDYVEDIIEKYRFKLKPLIITLPSNKGSRIRDIQAHYTQLFKRILGISITLGGV